VPIQAKTSGVPATVGECLERLMRATSTLPRAAAVADRLQNAVAKALAEARGAVSAAIEREDDAVSLAADYQSRHDDATRRASDLHTNLSRKLHVIDGETLGADRTKRGVRFDAGDVIEAR
jgi:hypothetical protein